MTDNQPIAGNKPIPSIVIGRLPVYLRALERMAAEGKEICSSHELGQRLGISSAQIRKDLSQFGEFGKQGIGYQIPNLVSQLTQILQVNRVWDVALVGAGDLGHALANYNGYVNRGFRIALIFDSDAAKRGETVNGIAVHGIDTLEARLKAHGIVLAMVAVPANAAQDVSDRLVKAGVRGILNYAPVSLTVPQGVQVQYIDPVVHLQTMTYFIDGADGDANKNGAG